MKRLGTALLVLVVGGLVFTSAAPAASLLVNNAGDLPEPTPNDGVCDVGAGACSLRAAIQVSQGTSNAGGDTISFSPGLSTIELTSELPAITQDLTVNGPGAGQLKVDGKLVSDWIFSSTGSNSVQISGLTITGGFSSGPAALASGVRNGPGSMLLDHVVVTGNSASSSSAAVSQTASGGGVYNGGALTVRDSIISGNLAGAFASTLNSPSVVARGGGIYSNNAGEPILIQRSTISGNSATANVLGSSNDNASALAEGAGIWNGAVSSLILDRSTISGNLASTIISPSFVHTGLATSRGGGIFNTGPADLRGSTVTGNIVSATGTSPAPVKAAANLAPSAQTVATGTIISEPAGSGNCNAQIATSNGYNLEGPANTCGFDNPDGTDHVNVADTGLDANLQDNGGPTPTHRLLPGSPAIDQGKASPGETTDQRGSPRPSEFTIANAPGGDGSDIGAYEVRAPLPAFTGIDPGPSGTADTPTIHGTVPADGGAATVQLFTDPLCSAATGPAASEAGFAGPGITVGPVAHNATTTFHGSGTDAYGTSLCASGIAYTHQDPPPPRKCKKGFRLKKIKKKGKPAKKKCVKKKKRRR
jgi:hypothetical protein